MLSTTWLLFGAALLMLDFCTFFPRLYAQPDKILHLLHTLSLFIAIVVPLALCLCSKIRSYFKSGVPKLNWASSLNIRYLIKRAQILDLPNRGIIIGFLILVLYHAIKAVHLSHTQVDINFA